VMLTLQPHKGTSETTSRTGTGTGTVASTPQGYV